MDNQVLQILGTILVQAREQWRNSPQKEVQSWIQSARPTPLEVAVQNFFLSNATTPEQIQKDLEAVLAIVALQLFNTPQVAGVVGPEQGMAEGAELGGQGGLAAQGVSAERIVNGSEAVRQTEMPLGQEASPVIGIQEESVEAVAQEATNGSERAKEASNGQGVEQNESNGLNHGNVARENVMDPMLVNRSSSAEATSIPVVSNKVQPAEDGLEASKAQVTGMKSSDQAPEAAQSPAAYGSSLSAIISESMDSEVIKKMEDKSMDPNEASEAVKDPISVNEPSSSDAKHPGNGAMAPRNQVAEMEAPEAAKDGRHASEEARGPQGLDRQELAGQEAVEDDEAAVEQADVEEAAANDALPVPAQANDPFILAPDQIQDVNATPLSLPAQLRHRRAQRKSDTVKYRQLTRAAMATAAPDISPEELRRQAMDHCSSSPIYLDEDLKVIEDVVFEYIFNPADTGPVPQAKKIRTVCARRLFYAHAKKKMVQNSKGIWSQADRQRTELARKWEDLAERIELEKVDQIKKGYIQWDGVALRKRTSDHLDEESEPRRRHPRRSGTSAN